MGINHRNRRFLQFGVIILVAIVLLGIGYAAISNILLTVNSTKIVVKTNQEKFKVHFTETQNITGTNYLVFKYNNELYYFRGGVDETNLDSTSKVIYQENKNILNSIFSNCREYHNESQNYNYYICIVFYGQTYMVSENDSTEVIYDDYSTIRVIETCKIDSNGKSNCRRTEQMTGPN